MRAFALYLNGKKIATAGFGGDGVLAANVTWVGRTNTKRNGAVDEVGVILGGLSTETGEHLR